MTIQLTSLQLKRLLKEAAAAGATAAMEAMAPKESELTKNDVKRWLIRIGKPAAFLERLEDEGLVKGERRGSKANSPIYYKRSDVETAMQSLNLFPVINV